MNPFVLFSLLLSSHSLNVPLHHICGHWSRLSQSEVCCIPFRAIWRHAYCVSNWRGRRQDSSSETLCRSETKTVSSIAFSCELWAKPHHRERGTPWRLAFCHWIVRRWCHKCLETAHAHTHNSWWRCRCVSSLSSTLMNFERSSLCTYYFYSNSNCKLVRMFIWNFVGPTLSRSQQYKWSIVRCVLRASCDCLSIRWRWDAEWPLDLFTFIISSDLFVFSFAVITNIRYVVCALRIWTTVRLVHSRSRRIKFIHKSVQANERNENERKIKTHQMNLVGVMLYWVAFHTSIWHIKFR